MAEIIHDITYSGEQLDRLLAYLEMEMATIDEIVGMEIDSRVSSPLVQIIDRGGDPFSPDDDFWHKHVLTSFPRCLVDPNGNAVTLGTNDRGDGLAALDGSAGDVMCQVPNMKTRVEIDAVTGGHITRIWYASLDTNANYFENFPGLGSDPQPYTYIGAYEASGYLDAETFKLRSASGYQPVTGGVGYTNLPNGGRFTIDDAILYAQNKGPGWDIPTVWDYASLQGRLYMIAGTMDLQAKYGRGIVDLPSGKGFAGKFTGADGVDALIDMYGCGAGSGNNGQTPVVVNGLENLPTGGNVYELVGGENMVAADGSVRLINPDGSGTPAGTLADGDYITLYGVVPYDGTDGYIGSFQATKYGALSWTPATTDASSSTGACDWFTSPRYDPSVVLFGGSWTRGSTAGVGCRAANCAPSYSYRHVGARLKFVPQYTT